MCPDVAQIWLDHEHLPGLFQLGPFMHLLPPFSGLIQAW